MILVSVGTQLPFDRMIRAVDEWAARTKRPEIIAQIGPSGYEPTAIESFAFLDHDKFKMLQQQCSLIVSHAGMGSIITAMELGKPIIIMARDHRRGEHRNGHQLATIKQFSATPGVYVASDESDLVRYLDQANTLTARPSLAHAAPAEFIDRLSDYIRTPRQPALMRRLRDLLGR